MPDIAPDLPALPATTAGHRDATAGTSRRAVLAAAGWSVPVISLATVAPAFAASGTEFTLSFSSASYRLPSLTAADLHAIFTPIENYPPTGWLTGVPAGPESDYPPVTSRFVTARTSAGDPVPGVPVTFTMTTPASTNLRFHPQGATDATDPTLATRTVTTGPDGVALMPRLFQLRHAVLPQNTYDTTITASVVPDAGNTFTPPPVVASLRRGNTAPVSPQVVSASGRVTAVTLDAGLSHGVAGSYHSLASGRLVVDGQDVLMPDGSQVFAPGTKLLVPAGNGTTAPSSYHFRVHHDRFTGRHGVTFFPAPLPSWWSTHPVTAGQPEQFVTVWPDTGDVLLSGVTDQVETTIVGPELLLTRKPDSSVVPQWHPHKLWYRGELVADWSSLGPNDFFSSHRATAPPVQNLDVRPSWITVRSSTFNNVTSTTPTLHHWAGPDDVRSRAFPVNTSVAIHAENIVVVNGVRHVLEASATPGELSLTPLALPAEAAGVVVRRRASGGVLAWYSTTTPTRALYRWTVEGGATQVSNHVLDSLHEGGVHTGASPSGAGGTAVGGDLLTETTIQDLSIRLDAEAELVEVHGQF